VSKDPIETWNKPEAIYAGSSVNTKLNLLTEAHNKKFGKGQTMSDHLGDLETIFVKLENTGHEVDSLLQVSSFLTSLQGNDEFESTIAAIRTLSDTGTTCEMVTTRLMDEYKTKHPQGVLSHESSSGPTVAYANSSKDVIGCSYCKKKVIQSMHVGRIQNVPLTMKTTRFSTRRSSTRVSTSPRTTRRMHTLQRIMRKSKTDKLQALP
jgi:gag-polypeptide of LTR copia-type